MPTVRSTSRQAHAEVMASGFIGVTLRRIYTTLFQHPRSTPNECCAHIERALGHRVNKPSYTPRFAVLERAQLIREVGKRICSVSNKECFIYETTRVVPTEKVKDTRNAKPQAYRVWTSGPAPLGTVKWYGEAAFAKALAYYERLVAQNEFAELALYEEKRILKTNK